MEQDKVDFSNRSVYTPSFTTSLTNVNGSISGSYLSDDGTTFAMLVSLEDASRASRDLANYAMVVAGTNENEELLPVPEEQISASLHKYGSTGKYLMVLYSPQGFSSDLLYALVSDRNGQYADAKAEFEKDMDASDIDSGDMIAYWESKTDDWSLIFNPGANDPIRLKSLSESTVDLAQVYAEIVTAPALDDVRSVLDNDVANLRLMQGRIAETMANLKELGVDINSCLPAYIKGDQFKGADDSLEYLSGATISTGYDFDWKSIEAGKTKLSDIAPDYLIRIASETDDDSMSSTVDIEDDAIDNSVDETASFDDGATDDSVVEPTIDDTVPEVADDPSVVDGTNDTPVDASANGVDESNGTDAVATSDYVPRSQVDADTELKRKKVLGEWAMTDGTKVVDLRTSDPDKYTEIASDINTLLADVGEYMALKETYQVEHLADICAILYDYETAVRNITSRADGDFCVIYRG